MRNPFLTKRWTLVIYFLSWIVIAGVHFFVLINFYNSNPLHALTDSIIYNLLFAFAGLSLWFIVRYNKQSNIGWQKAIINNLVSATAIILLITLFTFLLNYIIFKFSESYKQEFYQSIYFRLISSILYYSFLALIYYIQTLYLDFQEQNLRESHLQNMLKDAELTALKAQINPHFLFNSLNSASSLTLSKPEKAQEMIIKLSEYFRYTLTKSSSALVKIEEEIANSILYLEIEKIRFGDKLTIVKNIKIDNKEILVPAMLLQPLFENAVKHGVYESLEPTSIVFDCSENELFLLISISNKYSIGGSRKGTGKGLKIVESRLKIHYGEVELFNIEKTETDFIVQLKIPKNIENHETR